MWGCRVSECRACWGGFGGFCGPSSPEVPCALGRIGPQEVGADGGVRTVPVISECVHPMLLSGVSGLSSTVGCRDCRDCRDCRGVLDSARTWSLSRNILFAVGAVGLLSGLSGVGAVGTVERLSGSCRVRVSECRARAQACRRAASSPVRAGRAPAALWRVAVRPRPPRGPAATAAAVLRR